VIKPRRHPEPDLDQPGEREGAVTIWEYTSDSADVWEVHVLCNHFARSGWEPVLMAPIPADVVELPEVVGDEAGPRRAGRAGAPLVVLFRRPLGATGHYRAEPGA
jgi:hypothetical protein